MSEEVRQCSVDGCDKGVHGRHEWCNVHYRRWLKHGDPLAGGWRRYATTEESFQARITPGPNGCILWTASVNRAGYGQISIDGRGRHVHRYAWQRQNGPIPEGMSIDHVCHNRICVNPDHLRLATTKQNMENRPGAQRNSASGVRGVHWDKARKKWAAFVSHEGKSYSLGRFESIEDAEKAAIAGRNRLFTHNTLDRKVPT